MKRLFSFLGILLLVGGIFAFRAYRLVTGNATSFSTSQKVVMVKDGVDLEALAAMLVSDSIVSSADNFLKVAGWKRFETPKPGRYAIPSEITMNGLINKLRSGDQTPIKLTFTGVRTPQELAGRVSSQIAADSVAILQAMFSNEKASSYGFSKDAFRTMFIPNTYEVWFYTDEEAFVQRMANEFKEFWNEDRKAKATALGLSQSEVSILASIVKAETAKRDEAPKVAGLYLNRLRIGMPLQADPTLIYAHQDFTIKRVLDKHKEIDSPYNTYKHGGLPPGPINFPEPHYIDAVLNPTEHKFLYMCAKPDFSGYHNFSKSLRQHNVYAKEYQRALSKLLRSQR